MTVTFGKARDLYASHADIGSRHTMDAYLRAISLFFIYLNERPFASSANAENAQLSALSTGDVSVMADFARWLETPDGEQRPYARSTVELRVAGLQHWFQFIHERGWLPAEFELEQAVADLKRYMGETAQKKESASGSPKAVEAPQNLDEMLDYYAAQPTPKRLKQGTEAYQRWELTRLRNHAFLKTLGESGGQISAILSINIGMLATDQRPIPIDVVGKNRHAYTIYIADAYPSISRYLKARHVDIVGENQQALFISHDKRYDGNRMSRVIGWRMVQRAAKASGLSEVSPHDFRHWRAHQMIHSGASLEDVKVQLGHRSIHTVRAYYGHLLDTQAQDD